MHSPIETYCQAREKEFAQITSDRAAALRDLAQHLFTLLQKNAPAALIYICTHNSRRSHFGQVWAYTAAAFYGIRGITSYSGGTEATAFHPNAVAALQRVGFTIQPLTEGTNPHYALSHSSDALPCECFSKVYTHASNPQTQFVAVMMCSDADEQCPIVFGAGFRRSTPYADPKAYDGTVQQEQAYDDRCREIARDTLYLFSVLSQLLRAEKN